MGTSCGLHPVVKCDCWSLQYTQLLKINNIILALLQPHLYFPQKEDLLFLKILCAEKNTSKVVSICILPNGNNIFVIVLLLHVVLKQSFCFFQSNKNPDSIKASSEWLNQKVILERSQVQCLLRKIKQFTLKSWVIIATLKKYNQNQPKANLKNWGNVQYFNYCTKQHNEMVKKIITLPFFLFVWYNIVNQQPNRQKKTETTCESDI